MGDASIFLCPRPEEEPTTTSGLDESSCSYVGLRNLSAPPPDGPFGRFYRAPAIAADAWAEAHRGRRNVLFLDGHVEEVDEGEYASRHAPLLGR